MVATAFPQPKYGRLSSILTYFFALVASFVREVRRRQSRCRRGPPWMWCFRDDVMLFTEERVGKERWGSLRADDKAEWEWEERASLWEGSAQEGSA